MQKRHRKEVAIWIVIPIIIVLAILLLVYLFEILGIHVPGPREMWIGLIGAVLGGMFTMTGVLITVYKQEEQIKEDRRLGYMPILRFEIVSVDKIDKDCQMEIGGRLTFDGTLSCQEGELTTSAFRFVEEKICKAIEVSVLNNTCVFDFVIEGCLIKGKEIPKGSTFAPASRRLVSGEVYRLIFDNGDYSETNEACLIRFSYRDIFGNKYYQDLPIEYIEIDYNGVREHHIEIRDLKAPILVKEDVKTLEVVQREYCDFEIFVAD